MDRRSFLKTSALGGTAVAASTLAAPAYAAGKRVLTMVQSWHAALPCWMTPRHITLQ